MRKPQFPIFVLLCFVSSFVFGATSNAYKVSAKATPNVAKSNTASKPAGSGSKPTTSNVVKSVPNVNNNLSKISPNVVSSSNSSAKSGSVSTSSVKVPAIPAATSENIDADAKANKSSSDVNLLGIAENQDFYNTLPNILDQILPAVVTINAVKNSATSSDYYNDSSANTQSLGSGFIISDDGYIVTNNHVIDNAEKIDVKLKGSDIVFPANIVGIDDVMDIALLKIDLKNKLPFVEFDQTNMNRIGDLVIVAGNPYNLGISVSTGIISALNRNLQMSSFDNFIQTDASINKGNSGGPMFNRNGKVIGLTSAIYSPEGSNTGIGFAMPVSDLLPIISELKKYGYVRRGWIGVTTENAQKEIFDIINSQIRRGVIVIDVVDNSPAEKAGLMVSDIIFSYDDKKIRNVRDLSTLISSTEIGSQIKFGVLRNNKMLNIVVKIEENKQNYKYDQDYEALLSKSLDIFDMFLVPINKDSIKRFNITEGTAGMYVLKTKKDGLADKKGIKAGDVILSINQDVASSKNIILDNIHNAKLNKSNYVFLITKSSKNNLIFIPIRENKSSNTQS